MRISDWSSDVCSSDLIATAFGATAHRADHIGTGAGFAHRQCAFPFACAQLRQIAGALRLVRVEREVLHAQRSEEHTSALQSLMRISYAVLCLKKNNMHLTNQNQHYKTY